MQNVGAQAREVVEKYGNDIGAHPVGTGAFRLAEWKRSSRIVLARNENFRELYFDAEPPPDDSLSQQLYAEMKGKRIPQLDRVEVSIIEESQPRWLAFLNNELDWINLPYEFKNMAIPGEKLAPWLTKRGVRYIPTVEPVVTYLYFNMKDPVWGGYTPDKIALRRAISLAYNNAEEISLIRNGTAIEARSPIPPGVLGYDEKFTTGKTYDPAKAKALLDMFGFVDRDGDGWRDMPDGSPLTLVYATGPSQLERLFLVLWKKNLDSVGIRMEPLIEKWPDLRKKSKLGKLQSWGLAWGADYPDGAAPIAARPTTGASSCRSSTSSTRAPRGFRQEKSAPESTRRCRASSSFTLRGSSTCTGCTTIWSSLGCWAGASILSSMRDTNTSTSI